ncbi:hypothetical protein N7476_002426 [Penicillium atrosanguineum]|uniref:Uncharacterized protein n=1 Tax=Penicillium atrosanguineum TaxID=1132637 RepID=A0A9W9Q7R2_9EURO|nr:hypothetical protein N7476_002426 [Penicillium atrosanguineum]
MSHSNQVSQKHFVPGSIPVPPEKYEGEEYFCKFTPRIHRDAHLADSGCWQCQLDLLGSQGDVHAKAVRSGSNKSYAVGCINPTVGNFTALCASEAIPDRLALISYIVEYAYVHDDVIEYAEKKTESQLWEANNQLMEGLNDNGDTRLSTRNNVRRQLQAKMATELLEIDKEQGKEILRLWKEMSSVFVGIRDLEFKRLDDYLPSRAIDAGCPWTMSLLCFSMDFYLTKEEIQYTAALTRAAYDAWVLVNDYFSWEKEYQNYEANGSIGQIASAVYLFMKWHNIDPVTAKKMLRSEIIAREEKLSKLKSEYLARGNMTDRILKWIELLVLVTAGNFAWSMTTARYHAEAEDAYPGLRAANQNKHSLPSFDSFSAPITPRTIAVNGEKSLNSNAREFPDNSESSKSDDASSPPTSCDSSKWNEEGNDILSTLSAYEGIALEPYVYIKSLPSKGVRSAAIDGLDVWYQVPEISLKKIQEITDLLHSSSLMVDDIQDNSALRRGSPATHTVFGISQTINSANLLLMKALKAATALSATAVSIFTESLIEGHIGQGMDLYWTNQTKIPTREEYFTMVDGKTGGLFVLIAELMRSEATVNKTLDVKLLMKAVGRFFQARDDYKNLQDADYMEKKGFADDLSEGKISLPLLYALKAKTPQRLRLLNILQQRKAGNCLSPELRKLALDDIVAAGGLEYTKNVIIDLQEKVSMLLAQFEDQAGGRNWIIRLMKKRLEF